MKAPLVLLMTIAAAFAAPQYSFPNPAGGSSSSANRGASSSSSGGGYGGGTADVGSQAARYPSGGSCATTVKCERRESRPGVYDFSCETSNPCVISREDILWLKGSTDSQQLNVVVPNYKLEEVIKAAFKSAPGGATNVNILLKRPQQSVDAEADVSIPAAQAPEVNLEYEPAPPPERVHYPVDRQYRPLSGPILEPAGGNY